MSSQSYRLMKERDRLDLPQPTISSANALEMVLKAVGKDKATYGLMFPPDGVTVNNVWETLDAYHFERNFYDYGYSISFSIYTGEILQIHQTGIGRTATGKGQVSTTTHFPTPLLDAFNEERQLRTDRVTIKNSGQHRKTET